MEDIVRFRLVTILLMVVGLFFSGFSAASAQGDAGGTPIPGCGTVTFSVFYSENDDDPIAMVSDPSVDAASEKEEGTFSAAAVMLEIYANGDLTSDPVQTLVTNDGGTAVSECLAAGDYSVLETSTNTFFDFTIGDGATTTTITILFPVVEDGTPVGDDDDGVAGDDGASDDDSATGGDVSALPSTGQGNDSSNGSTIVLLFGAMSMVALAAGFAWRQRRTA